MSLFLHVEFTLWNTEQPHFPAKSLQTHYIHQKLFDMWQHCAPEQISKCLYFSFGFAEDFNLIKHVPLIFSSIHSIKDLWHLWNRTLLAGFSHFDTRRLLTLHQSVIKYSHELYMKLKAIGTRVVHTIMKKRMQWQNIAYQVTGQKACSLTMLTTENGTLTLYCLLSIFKSTKKE